MRDIQNPLRNSYRIICVVFLIFGLLLAGCTTVDESGQTVPDSNAATPGNTGTVATTESMQTFDHPDATENTRKTDDSPASIVAFRQGLVGTPQMFAVAYFGYASSDGNMTTNPYVVMAGAAPQLCADLPFLQQIPAANIVGTNGNLFCVIPADVNATVAVNRTPWNESTGTYEDAIVLYRSEAGDPFLLMTHDTPECMETEVIITDSQGNVTIWYPFVDA